VELEAFADTGYVHLPNLLSEAQLEKWRSVFDRAFVSDAFPDSSRMDNPRFRQVVNGWRFDADCRALMLDPELGAVMTDVSGIGDVRLCFGQFMLRHGYSSGGQFHLDQAAWPFTDGRAAVMWIALDDSSVESGCVWYLPGTHKDEAYESGFGTRYALDAVCDDRPHWRRIAAVPVPAGAGDGIVHSGLVAHLGGPNMTPNDRRVVVLHGMPASAQFNGRTNRYSPATNDLPLGTPLELDDEYPMWSMSGGAETRR